MGTVGIWSGLVVYGSSIVCVCPGAAWAAPSQGNLTLGDSSHRGLTMGKLIGQRSMLPDQEVRCQGGLGVDLASLSSTRSGEPDAGCQLSPSVDHGGTHRSTLDTPEPGQQVSWGLTQRYLCEGQSGEPDAEPSYMSKTGHGGTYRSMFDAASLGDWWVYTWLP